MGLIFGVLLGVASKVFAVKEDERVPKILEVLPGANCGGCGFAGCSAYATALCKGGVKTNMCPVGGDAVSEKISEIMGVKNEVKEKWLPVFYVTEVLKEPFKNIILTVQEIVTVLRVLAAGKKCVLTDVWDLALALRFVSSAQ